MEGRQDRLTVTTCGRTATRCSQGHSACATADRLETQRSTVGTELRHRQCSVAPDGCDWLDGPGIRPSWRGTGGESQRQFVTNLNSTCWHMQGIL